MKPTSRDSAALPATKPISRRRAVRLDAPPTLCVHLSDKRVFATAIDVGLGGLGLLSNVPLEPEKTYEITLRLGSHSLTCAATVAHCRRQDDGYWQVGLAFVRDERYPKIGDFVDTLMQSQIEFG